MCSRHRTAYVATVAAAGWCALAATVLGQDGFRARLTPMPIEVATRAQVTGSGSASATLQGDVLSVTGSFSGMRGPATVAQVHESPTLGVRGPALFDLVFTPAPEGTFSGKAELSDERLESLREGLLYVQIHSESAPEGNLWGWLLPPRGGK